MGLDVRLRRVNGALVVGLDGELDIYTAGEIRPTLTQNDDPHVVVDLSHVDLIDSAGIGILVSLRRTGDGEPRRVTLVCPDSSQRRLFEIVGLMDHFEVVDDLASVTFSPR